MNLAAGADNVIATTQGVAVRCTIHAFDRIAAALEKAGLKPVSSEIAYIPASTVPIPDAPKARAIEELHGALGELDDVQAVFSNEEAE